MGLLAELKRRKVFKVAAAYLVVGWLMIEVSATVLPQLNFPEWAPRMVTFAILLGFPVAVVMAWVFDVTPEGIKVDAARVGSKRIFSVAAVLAALALAWYFHEQSQPGATAPAATTVATQPTPAAVPAVSDNSVAVLPFVNMSGKPDQEYFSDGMTEELLNVLAKMPNLKVAARTSVFEFKNKGGDVREIGRKLGVSHIVEGSVRRDGQEIRVTAQLIRVSDGFHVWSETYDRKLESVFALQDDIASRIAQQLDSSIGGVVALQARAEIPPKAYEDYLKGRALYRSRKDLMQAIAYFESAVAHAPEFAEGWASLSLTYEVVEGYVTREQYAQLGDALGKCREAALRAEALAPDAPMTLHALGNVARFEYRYADAERLYERSIRADPSYPDVREDYSELFEFMGRYEDALRASRQLVTLEPYVANFWSSLMYAAYGLDRRADVDEAVAHIQAIDPDSYDAVAGKYLLDMNWGRIEQARIELAKASKRDPVLMADDVLLFRWATREHGVDLAALEAVFVTGRLHANPPTYAAWRGDFDRVLAYYHAAPPKPKRRVWFYDSVNKGPAKKILADPRAKQLLRDYGFEAYWREKGWPALCRPLGVDDFECGPAVNKDGP